MKVLFNIILIALSLIIQPALAWQDYDIRFVNEWLSKSLNVPFKPGSVDVYYLSKINDSCIAAIPNPLNFKFDESTPEHRVRVQDINSGTTCVGRQKKIIWAVSTKKYPASLDFGACFVQWSVTYYCDSSQDQRTKNLFLH
ncbi:hypothetical protein PXH59_10385 [Xenorhabdus sp. SF857]|uniref:hypothetical protein n=1 Tax=Xenorhabdus bakwenae TaxID=3026967 RepID=UPI00255825EE|nr:hypothetical protein [Xenorhabdus sp. SF857]WFQ78193.1 hypothetical protein PXH59_10385 [Xenorhabdus sp. SF857]